MDIEKIDMAIAEALGDAYDCTRAWSAWGYGTMHPDDFVEVSEQPERIAEIREAVLGPVKDEFTKLRTALAASQAREAKLRDLLLQASCWVDLDQMDGGHQLGKKIEAMFNTTNNTALREMLAAAKAEECGRISRLVAAHIPQPSPLDSERSQGYYAALKDVAESIAQLKP